MQREHVYTYAKKTRALIFKVCSAAVLSRGSAVPAKASPCATAWAPMTLATGTLFCKICLKLTMEFEVFCGCGFCFFGIKRGRDSQTPVGLPGFRWMT